jgi:hypothetical protein
MADNEKPIDLLLKKIDDYVKSGIELAKYKAIDKISDVIGALIPYIFESLLILFFIFLLSIGLALWLGTILGKTYLGFCIIAGLYVIAAIVLRLFLSKWIKDQISGFIIKLIPK